MRRGRPIAAAALLSVAPAGLLAGCGDAPPTGTTSAGTKVENRPVPID